MKKNGLIFFLFITFLGFSQKKVSKRFELQTKEIAIQTNGLDNLVIENSNSKFVEVILFAESYDDQLIKIKEKEPETRISFYFEGSETREVIFRKFITKRLQRAEAIIKIPKNKAVSIYGQNVDIQSKNCSNTLSIFIENGIVKLNKIQKNTIVKLYAGNVFASSKNFNLNVKTNLGKLRVNDKSYKESFIKQSNSTLKELKIESIKANIFLRFDEL